MNATPYHLIRNGVIACNCPYDGGPDLPRNDLNIRIRWILRYSGETLEMTPNSRDFELWANSQGGAARLGDGDALEDALKVTLVIFSTK